MDEIILFLMFSITAFFAMAFRPAPVSVSEAAAFAVFGFVITLFIERFVIYAREIFLEVFIALLTSLLSLIASVSGWLAAVMPLVWVPSCLCIYRYLRDHHKLNDEDAMDFIKDIALISVIFVLTIGGFPNIPKIVQAHDGALTIALVAFIAVQVIIMEYHRNDTEPGTRRSILKVKSYFLESSKERIAANDPRVLITRQGILHHIVARDVIALLVLVVVPFVATVAVSMAR